MARARVWHERDINKEAAYQFEDDCRHAGLITLLLYGEEENPSICVLGKEIRTRAQMRRFRRIHHITEGRDMTDVEYHEGDIVRMVQGGHGYVPKTLHNKTGVVTAVRRTLVEVEPHAEQGRRMVHKNEVRPLQEGEVADVVEEKAERRTRLTKASVVEEEKQDRKAPQGRGRKGRATAAQSVEEARRLVEESGRKVEDTSSGTAWNLLPDEMRLKATDAEVNAFETSWEESRVLEGADA